MDFHTAGAQARRFSAYVGDFASVLGRADRHAPMCDYCTGLLLPGDRKSVEPMAALTAPTRVSAQQQSLSHFVAKGDWSDELMMAKIREKVLPAIEAREPIAAWIIDDTGFPKKGTCSVGVARQYCGQLGKQDNCQVAVSLSVANHHASLPVAWRMYLPKLWADDSARREKAGIPDAVVFKTKPQIALDQIKRACDVGLPRGTVLMDAGYGVDTDLRTEITALGLQYAVGVGPQTTVWAAGQRPLPPKAYSGRGRPPSRPRRDTGNAPVSIEALASAVPKQSWHTIEWREGTSGTLKSRFYRTRVRVAHNRKAIPEDIHEEWLLAEWPEDEKAPTKYWLSTLDETVSFRKLVDITKLRWRIERDYLELKQEVGLGHYEGRGWRGFHHHATLCIATYGFLVAERAAFPPSEPRRGYLGEKPALPRDYRPRGAANPA